MDISIMDFIDIWFRSNKDAFPNNRSHMNIFSEVGFHKRQVSSLIQVSIKALCLNDQKALISFQANVSNLDLLVQLDLC